MSDDSTCPVCGGSQIDKSITGQLICVQCGNIISDYTLKIDKEFKNADKPETRSKLGPLRRITKTGAGLNKRLGIIKRRAELKEKLKMRYIREKRAMSRDDSYFTSLQKISFIYCEIMAKFYGVDIEEALKHIREQIIQFRGYSEDPTDLINQRLNKMKAYENQLKKYKIRDKLETYLKKKKLFFEHLRKKKESQHKEESAKEEESVKEEESENTDKLLGEEVLQKVERLLGGEESEGIDKLVSGEGFFNKLDEENPEGNESNWLEQEYLKYSDVADNKHTVNKYSEKEYEIFKKSLVSSIEDPFIKEALSRDMKSDDLYKQYLKPIKRLNKNYQKTGDIIVDTIEKYRRGRVVLNKRLSSEFPLFSTYIALFRCGHKIPYQIFFKDVVNQRLPIFSNLTIIESLRSDHKFGNFIFNSFGQYMMDSLHFTRRLEYWNFHYNIGGPFLTIEESMKSYINELDIPEGFYDLAMILYGALHQSHPSVYTFMSMIFLAVRFSTLGWDKINDKYFVNKYIHKYSYSCGNVLVSTCYEIELLNERGKVEQLIDAMTSSNVNFQKKMQQTQSKNIPLYHIIENWKRRTRGLESISFRSLDDVLESELDREFINDVDSFEENGSELKEEDDELKEEDDELKEEQENTENIKGLVTGYFIQDLESSISEKRLRPVKIKNELKEKNNIIKEIKEWFGINESKEAESLFKPIRSINQTEQSIKSPLKNKDNSLSKHSTSLKITKILTKCYSSLIASISYEQTRKKSYIPSPTDVHEQENLFRAFFDFDNSNPPPSFKISFKPIQTEFDEITVDEQQTAMFSVRSLMGKEYFQIAESFDYKPFVFSSVEMMFLEVIARKLSVSCETLFRDVVRHWYQLEKSFIYPCVNIKRKDFSHFYHSSEKLVKTLFNK
ncbi:hypothetical protein EDI_012320 [Entamoeba dispar SAW760]|uniref:TFIIB-type domain-containing protein n=1 Tax=Entamoeba dispar (strain ATCC PRA-260 / SAW760) TaxID=370354 RepID=B0E7X0_ENTDS|nr:uncharacterized protein EDI_012320 [Entamoeba dispar SAW760]EDR29360.1 hypothetical protein EDI_012320 [Entamoeba dispar SAW760]|eukprot:EDR29360.1 hypothetical protein EDI_012320 [Entamoeba dispar SAW760]